jgi:undecaprenyl phosphate N,N'-diacetylbacillosamine 1-phosphate transferase
MRVYIIFKRIIDFLFALFLLILVSPIMFFVYVGIKLDSKGPALYKQQRPGKNAKLFMMYKFRTMKVEIEKDGRPLSDMERMSRVGSLLRKTSLDELPQLINIIRGDMSFIGPRPLLVQYLDYYSTEQNRRHEVTSGISGWAQVNGRNTITWEEKFRYDVWYVDHISLLLDLKILWLTIINVIKKKDINHSEVDTMPFFTGSNPKN